MTPKPYLLLRQQDGTTVKQEIDLRYDQLVVPFPDGGTSVTIRFNRQRRLCVEAGGQDHYGLVIHNGATRRDELIIEPALRRFQECFRDQPVYDDD